MARPLRLEFPGAIYHLTSRGNAKQKIYLGDDDRWLFLDTLAGVASRYGWICHAGKGVRLLYRNDLELPSLLA